MIGPAAGRRIAGLFLLTALLVACGASGTPPVNAQPAELRIFAAASLTDAFTGLGALFEAGHPGATVAFNFAGSNQLAEQINQAAPADVFASANVAQMQAAIEGGRIAAGSEQTFARNRLVVVVPLENRAGLHELSDLATPGVKIVFAAQAVPVGQYSLDFLEKASAADALGPSFQDGVLANVVSYEENVRAVLTKVSLGEADAGIVYTSDVTGDGASLVGQIEIPDAWNTVATYPIAVLNDSPQLGLARAFVALVLSEDGQALMEQYGLLPAP